MTSLAVVDYGVGNIRSITKALERLGCEVRLTREPGQISKADALVLPGVGAFREAISNLEDSMAAIQNCSARGTPILGVCLGLQLLFERSEEGGLTSGLGLLGGEVVKLPSDVKIPHIGWNNIRISKVHPLLDGVEDNSYLYFVHSYYAMPKNKNSIIAETQYSVAFPSIVAEAATVGTQFHPEKSGLVGLRLLENFVSFVRR